MSMTFVTGNNWTVTFFQDFPGKRFDRMCNIEFPGASEKTELVGGHTNLPEIVAVGYHWGWKLSPARRISGNVGFPR
jgi:hypothetical protein